MYVYFRVLSKYMINLWNNGVFANLQDGVQPMWEDASNKNGGRWLVNLNKNQRQTELDNFWLETVSDHISQIISYAKYLENRYVQSGFNIGG